MPTIEDDILVFGTEENSGKDLMETMQMPNITDKIPHLEWNVREEILNQ